MSTDEAIRLLEAAGYETPKRKPTEIERLQEQLNELKTMIANQQAPAPVEPNPQRKSMVNGSNVGTTPKAKIYTHGAYLREQINGLNWGQLADRTAPLPADLNLEFLIKEFEQLYALQYDDKWGTVSALLPQRA